jgi:radical SAM protein with 4Fe4S-binding SPASM domain
MMGHRQWRLARWWGFRKHLLRWACDGRRIANVLRLAFSRLLSQPRPAGLPVIVGIEPTNRCNLKCPMCHRTHHPPEREADLSFADFRRLLDEIGGTLLCVFLWNQGEPLLNADLPRMVAYARGKGVLTMVSTNASLLGPGVSAELIAAGLDQLIVCLDGATSASYSRCRPGADFDAVVGNVRGFVQERRRRGRALPFVELQFLAMRDNEHEVEAVRALGRGLGVDQVSIKRIEMPEPGLRERLFPRNRDLVLGVYKGGDRRRPCFRPWYSSLIGSDGTVLACCHDFLARHPFGNALERPFREIWESRAYQEFRGLAARGGLDVCVECPAANFDGDYSVP